MSIAPESRERFDREALVHAEALYRFARRLASNDDQAEDLVQECFEKALRSFHQYKAGTNCKSWLFTILHNCHRMRLRSAQNRREVLDPGDDPKFSLIDHLLEHEVSSEQAFFDSTPSAEVRQAVGELSEALRSVVLLSDVEGLTYQEIAEVLSVPLGTVRSRLNRARTSLSQKLWKVFRGRMPALVP
ncbi:MAG: sigma-70 family RNA polymerase sigma factor [Vulcanimicrobiota bacterium]